jgi:hypothetical protein
LIDCSRCGDFHISREAADDYLPIADERKKALASFMIRKLTASGARANLSSDFFVALRARNLPTPQEASDNALIWLAEKASGSFGSRLEVTYSPELLSTLGVMNNDDVAWIMRNFMSQGIFEVARGAAGRFNWAGHLAAQGWKRYDELKRAHVSSRFAFFARQFTNPDLDTLFKECLRPAVEATGYELRMAMQRAGLIDAVIEDEIRRCRFVVVGLSDHNAGAYWEAGLAEGLGKDAIYICRCDKETHFDTNHRQTVKWDLADLPGAATKLKAVIRNTLLGDAIQSD